MIRQIRLSDMSEREKDSAILTLSALAKAQYELLHELADRSPYAKRRMEKLVETHEPRLAFLERAYVRGLNREWADNDVRRNEVFWNQLEDRA